MRYVKDFKDGERVIDHYLCKKKQSLKSKVGKTYISLLLQDKTGTIDSKIWDMNNSIQSFDEGDFVKIDGVVSLYQNDLQLRVTKIRRSTEGEYSPEDYIPTTSKNVDELFNKIKDFINSFENKYVKEVITNIIINNTEISKFFKTHSAAKTMHHSYSGGLIEHTLSVVEICDFMSTRYKDVNRDVLLAGAMLHDIGKVYELSSFPENDYTDEGQLLGHIIIGVELLNDEAKKIDGFPKNLLNAIKHCLLAHHGEFIYGSPKIPQTIEAFILHCADNMDAKIKIVEETIEKDSTRGNWVGYQKNLERNIRKSNYEE